MMYPASFPKTIAHLKTTFAPEEYLDLMKRAQQKERLFPVEIEAETYWRKLPTYLFARCPICGAKYTGAADTHSLLRWLTTIQRRNCIFSAHFQEEGCAHFTAVQTFINFNDCVPSELSYLSGRCGDIPIVVPELLLDEFHASAVIHSLPICRVAEDGFVPLYSLYTVTYYSDTPGLARPRSYDLRFPGEGDEESGPLPLFDSSARIRREPVVGDLRHWVERRKLHWLDLDDPTLPLKSGPASDFPYAGIQGLGVPYLYEKTPKPRWRWLDRNWHPDGVVREWGRNRVLLRPP